MTTMQIAIKDRFDLIRTWFEQDIKRVYTLGGAGVVLGIYFISNLLNSAPQVNQTDREKSFKPAAIVENPYKDLYKNKIELLEGAKRQIREDGDRIKSEVSGLKSQIEELKAIVEKQQTKPNETPVQAGPPNQAAPVGTAVDFSAATVQSGVTTNGAPRSLVKLKRKPVLSKHDLKFPVKVQKGAYNPGIVLSRGSYVKAKIIAGARIPESETYPLLLQLDYAFVMPSQRKIDLSGCMVIAKAEANMSTERITGSPDSIACFSKNDKFFEKTELKGWLSDSLDGEFSLSAEVVTNQGRVAKWAFTKSMLDGAMEIIDRKSKNMGGSNPDKPDLLVQQGATQSASMFADFLLKQAKSLLPYLHMKSGGDAWLVMGETIRLPYDFFKKGESDEFEFVTDLVN